jgi:hypothetical protein
VLLALVVAALLEIAYGCAGDKGVAGFIEENVGEVAEALNCDFINCVAPDPCHTVAGNCDGLGHCSFPPATDGTPCGGGKVCSSGACVADCFIGGTLYTAGTANPGNVCQVCTPASSTTAWSNLADGSACAPGKVCAAGACVADCFIGAALFTAGAANSSDPCQVCTPASSTSSWVNLPDGTSCTLTRVCSSGSCVAQCYVGGVFYGNGVANPANACQVCAPASSTSAWSNQTDGTGCTLADACSQMNTCQAGVCTSGGMTTCMALDACHSAGTCAPTTGVCSDPTKPDGTNCGPGLVCNAGLCNGVNLCMSVTCMPLDQCHVAGTCAPSTGKCTNPNQPDGTTCDDGNPATVNDVCKSGVCAGVDNCKGVTCSAMDQCHTAGTCDPATGVCSNPTKADGTTCDDNNPNTLDDQCTGGVCKGSQPCVGVVCMGIDACHAVGTCSPTTGKCTNPNRADGTPCSDGTMATKGFTCTGGVCGPPNPCTGIACPAVDDCHEVGVCQLATVTCTNPAKPDGAICKGGVCKSGACILDSCASTTCTAMDECHDPGTCDHGTGTCSNPAKANGTACSKGACEGGVCEPTNYYACAAAPPRRAPSVAGLLAAAAALAGIRYRRRRSRGR